jgi:hypothetical protein
LNHNITHHRHKKKHRLSQATKLCYLMEHCLRFESLFILRQRYFELLDRVKDSAGVHQRSAGAGAAKARRLHGQLHR